MKNKLLLVSAVFIVFASGIAATELLGAWPFSAPSIANPSYTDFTDGDIVYDGANDKLLALVNGALVELGVSTTPTIANKDNANDNDVLGDTSSFILADTSTSFTLKLPASHTNGTTITFKTNGSGTLTINPNTNEIDGSSSNFELRADKEYITVVSDGTDWHIKNKMFLEKVSATSSNFLLTTSGYDSIDWAQMSGNSVTLGSGTWECTGKALFDDIGSSGVTLVKAAWGDENGDNTSGAPANPTLDFGSPLIQFANSNADYSDMYIIAPTIILTKTTSDDLYLNAAQTVSTKGTSYINVKIDCRRVN